jgi:serine/threonine-protein kinase
VQGETLDGRSDVYALGVLLFQLATGHLPFQAEKSQELMAQHLHDPLPSPRALNPDLPEALETVIARAMAKNREERYATAHDMVEAVQAAIAGAPLPPATTGPPDEEGVTQPLPRWKPDTGGGTVHVSVDEVAQAMLADAEGDSPQDAGAGPAPAAPEPPHRQRRWRVVAALVVVTLLLVAMLLLGAVLYFAFL